MKHGGGGQEPVQAPRPCLLGMAMDISIGWVPLLQYSMAKVGRVPGMDVSSRWDIDLTLAARKAAFFPQRFLAISFRSMTFLLYYSAFQRYITKN